MPRYRVLTKSFINNTIHEEGAVIDYDGKPGSNLKPVRGKDADVPGAKQPAPDAGSAGEALV